MLWHVVFSSFVACQDGKYCVLKMDPSYVPEETETRQVYGLYLQQPQNNIKLTDLLLFNNVVTKAKDLPDGVSVRFRVSFRPKGTLPPPPPPSQRTAFFLPAAFSTTEPPPLHIDEFFSPVHPTEVGWMATIFFLHSELQKWPKKQIWVREGFLGSDFWSNFA